MTLLFLLLFFGALFAVLSTRPSAAAVREGALLLKLDGYVVEERSPIDPVTAFLTGEAPVREYPVREVVRALNAAAGDARVKAVVLDLDTFLGGGQVHLQDIGAALERVRASGKPVLSFATLYTDDSYLLAAHANEVWVNPLGGTLIAGVGGNNLYFGEFLNQLKVNARVYKVGDYKAAVEPFTRNEPSAEARENARALYGALWEEWLAHVRKARPKANIDFRRERSCRLA